MGRKRAIMSAFSVALQDLLEKKDLDNIYVSDIIEVAGISKSTFYRYFQDKYDLAIWCYVDLLDKLIGENVSFDGIKKIADQELEYMSSNRQFFKKLFDYKGQNSFAKYYMENALVSAENICRKKHCRGLSQEEKYTIIYHTSGMLSVVDTWLHEDKTTSVEQLSNLIDVNRSTYVKELYVKSK